MIRLIILKKIYQLFPFNLEGDLIKPLPRMKNNFISCLLCTARETQQLEQLLIDFTKQTLNKDSFELVILDNSLPGLEDLVKKYSKLLNIFYIRNTSKEGLLGILRNETLQKAQGEFVLFLDDDTRLPQKDFLEESLSLFKQSNSDVIIPYGKALIKEGEEKYQFLDSYSFATRCILYKRTSLEDIGGYYKNLVAYEDIDLGIRMTLKGFKILETNLLHYQHPPLYFTSLQKPLAIGQSILKLREHYPWLIWLTLYLNALRFLPLALIPTTQNRQWFKISLGVLLAPFSHKKFTY